MKNLRPELNALKKNSLVDVSSDEDDNFFNSKTQIE